MLVADGELGPLLLSLLLLPLPVPNAAVTVLPFHLQVSFQHFDPKARMVLVVAGEMTVRATAVNLMPALIGHKLKVAHDDAWFFHRRQPHRQTIREGNVGQDVLPNTCLKDILGWVTNRV